MLTSRLTCRCQCSSWELLAFVSTITHLNQLELRIRNYNSQLQLRIITRNDNSSPSSWLRFRDIIREKKEGNDACNADKESNWITASMHYKWNYTQMYAQSCQVVTFYNTLFSTFWTPSKWTGVCDAMHFLFPYLTLLLANFFSSNKKRTTSFTWDVDQEKEVKHWILYVFLTENCRLCFYENSKGTESLVLNYPFKRRDWPEMNVSLSLFLTWTPFNSAVATYLIIWI